MKNLPSFKQFKDNYSLLESADSNLEELYSDLVKDYTPYSVSVNEGLFGDSVKNWASKTFLGALGLSKVKYIDKARDIHLGLQLHLLDKKHEYKDKLEEYKSKLDTLSDKVDADKPKIEAINKKIEEEERIYDAYEKAQKLKIEKAKDIIESAIDGNARRRSYAEVGLAEDKIILAEKEYEYAKKESAETGDLDELTDRIKKLRNSLEDKIKEFKESEEEKEKKEEKITKNQKDIVSDSIAKKIIEKVKGIKPKGIIDLTEEIKKDIVSLEAEHERLEEQFSKKKKAGNMSMNSIKSYKTKLKVISSEIEGRKKQLEVLRDLGKDSISITKNLKNPKKSQDVLDKISKIDMDVESKKA
jgi:hypothetical protein